MCSFADLGNVKHGLKTAVNVYADKGLVPFQDILVEFLVERGTFEAPPAVDSSVNGGQRSVGQSGSDKVPSLALVGWVVSPCFEDVDLTRDGPGPVGVVLWQKPDGGPEPVAFWELCANFDASVCQCLFGFCGEATGHYWGYDEVLGGGGRGRARTE